MKLVWLVILLSLLSLTGAVANPFASGKSTAQKEITAEPQGNAIYNYLSDKQRDIKRKLTSLFYDIKEKPFSGTYIAFLLLCFAYGVVHSLGPGHAKSLVSGYLLSTPAGLARSAFFGGLVAFGHAFSAFLLVGIIYYILHASVGKSFDTAYDTIAKFSYSIIFMIGLYLLASKLRGRQHRAAPAGRGFVSTAILISVTPCPGAMVLSMFAFTNGMVFTGLLSVFAMASGMALTICGVAVFTYFFRSAVSAGGRYKSVYGLLEYAGIFLLLSFSGFLIIS